MPEIGGMTGSQILEISNAFWLLIRDFLFVMNLSVVDILSVDGMLIPDTVVNWIKDSIPFGGATVGTLMFYSCVLYCGYVLVNFITDSVS